MLIQKIKTFHVRHSCYIHGLTRQQISEKLEISADKNGDFNFIVNDQLMWIVNIIKCDGYPLKAYGPVELYLLIFGEQHVSYG